MEDINAHPHNSHALLTHPSMQLLVEGGYKFATFCKTYLLSDTNSRRQDVYGNKLNLYTCASIKKKIKKIIRKHNPIWLENDKTPVEVCRGLLAFHRRFHVQFPSSLSALCDTDEYMKTNGRWESNYTQ